MANAKFYKGAQAIWSGSINILTDDIRLAFVSGAYTPNLATDQFLSTIGSAIIARSGTIAGRAFSGNILTATNTTVSLVPGPTPIVYVVIFKWTGSDSTSPLLIKDDTANNLPNTPNGGDITVQWDALNGVTQL